MALRKAAVPKSYVSSDSLKQRNYTKASNTSAQYEEHDPISHALARPDTLVGSVLRLHRPVFLFDGKTYREEQVDFPPAIERILLEIISNAADNADRSRRAGVDPGILEIRIEPIPETQRLGRVTVRNGGLPIPLDPHFSSTIKQVVYAPSRIFGALRTSNNYNNDVENMGVGKNGYGAKLAVIFSDKTIVTCADATNGQLWHGEWHGVRQGASGVYEFNMVKEEVSPGYIPKRNGTKYITEDALDENGQVMYDELGSRVQKICWDIAGTPYRGESFTEFSYDLSLDKFGYDEYPKEFVDFARRIAVEFGYASKIPVIFNGEKYNMGSINSLAMLRYPEEAVKSAIVHYQWRGNVLPNGWEQASEAQRKKYIENPPDGSWIPVVEVMILDTPDHGSTVSFVNGLLTHRGGVHVEAVYDVIRDQVIPKINEKGASMCKKDESPPKIDKRDLKPHISFIISVRVANPVFSSQEKTEFTGPNIKLTVDSKVFEVIWANGKKRWKLMDRLMASLAAKIDKKMKFDEGKHRKGFITDMPNLKDCNNVVHPETSDCTLMITEGKSAMGYPNEFIKIMPDGNDNYGRCYIRGKFCNPENMTIEDLYKNPEVIMIKKAIGLEEGVDYTIDANYKRLRYKHILIMTDMDSDGSHIRMLLISFFKHKYPSLLQRNFIMYFMSYCIRIYDKRDVCIMRFADDNEFRIWNEEQKAAGIDVKSKYNIKYFKGLGTNSVDDILDDLQHGKMIVCVYDKDAPAMINMAFSKEKDASDGRKEWMNHQRKFIDIPCDDICYELVDCSLPQRTITSIINRDLLLYTIASLFRAIPDYRDLFKLSQRQIIWTMLEVCKKQEAKAAVIMGNVMAKTHYEHGDSSIYGTLAKLSQGYVGACNLTVIKCHGLSGSREELGDDMAQARYLSYSIQEWVKHAINKDLMSYVSHRELEGHQVESEYIPFDIPIGLINGTKGLATGWGTRILPHCPIDVIDALISLIQTGDFTPLKPKFRGFKGKIEFKDSKHKQIVDISKIDKEEIVDFSLDDLDFDIDERKDYRPKPKKEKSEAAAADCVPDFGLDEEVPSASSSKKGKEEKKGKKEEIPDFDLDDVPDFDLDEKEEPEEKSNVKKNYTKSVITYGNYQIVRTHPNGAIDIVIDEIPIGVAVSKYRSWCQKVASEGGYDGLIAAEFIDVGNSTKHGKAGKKKNKDDIHFVLNKLRLRGEVKKSEAAKKRDEKLGAKELARVDKVIDKIDHKSLGLISKLGYSSITLINNEGFPVTLDNTNDVLRLFHRNMLEQYSKFFIDKLKDLRREAEICQMIIKFARLYREEVIILKHKSSAEVKAQMAANEIDVALYEKIGVHHLAPDTEKKQKEKYDRIMNEIAEMEKKGPSNTWLERLKKLRAVIIKTFPQIPDY